MLEKNAYAKPALDILIRKQYNPSVTAQMGRSKLPADRRERADGASPCEAEPKVAPEPPL